ncbi:hypothetical protein [Acinetobacter baumannii]|uniref:hypothetical protein n=1 Tax=Acinetobacter baumannii TaxID=470 RepID=UPI00135F54AE|nr:hypothetical protein [Acinetobacter baumannii]MCF4554835.1 hypothetical protein [Acinetobacter baumannii]MCF4588685.1 hypothetical protein [Acinetobacter baumannii]MCF4627187.1 hypothetical protein [Acinetobacter baumannii]MDX7905037.1 hypothetical protein [Acinetobacter baumannii]MDX7908416.1 hypothetical protein [Acinetobacter baumannii]
MYHLVPDLSKDILPSKEAAGISLGMDFDEFRNSALFRDVGMEEFESAQEKNIWLVLHRYELLPWQEWINEIYCSWESSVTLTFDGNSKKLIRIFLGEGYNGKLLGLLGIGDRLDLVKDDFNFYFSCDAHYLEYKQDSDMFGEIIPAEISTNYRTAYSEEYSDQIIEGIMIYTNSH